MGTRIDRVRVLVSAGLAVTGARVAQADERAPPTVVAPEEVIEVVDPIPPDDPTRSVTVVSGESARTSTAATTLEALAIATPGMHVTRRGAGAHGIGAGAGGGISLRGLGGSPTTQIVVVEDGVVELAGIFGHPMADALSAPLIGSVEVVRGGDTVAHGGGAMGGAIVVTSRWLAQDGVESQLDAQVGSFATTVLEASLLGRRGRWDGAAAVSNATTDGHRHGLESATTVAQVGGRLRLANSALWARGKLLVLAGADPGPSTHPFEQHDYEAVRARAVLGFDHQRGRDRVTVRAHAATGQHDFFDGFSARDRLLGATVTGRRDLGVVAIAVGADVRHLTADLGAQGSIPARTTTSAMAETTARLGRFTLVGGTRAFRLADGTSALAGAAGVHVVVANGLTARARVSRDLREPTLRELYLPFPVANPALQPERSSTAEVGLAWRGAHSNAGIAAYRTGVRDLIRYFGAFPAIEAVNIDRAEVYGLELEAGVQHGPVRWWLTGAVQDVGRYTRQAPRATCTTCTWRTTSASGSPTCTWSTARCAYRHCSPAARSRTRCCAI